MGLPLPVQILARCELISRIRGDDGSRVFVIDDGFLRDVVDDLVRRNAEFSAGVSLDNFGGLRSVRLDISVIETETIGKFFCGLLGESVGSLVDRLRQFTSWNGDFERLAVAPHGELDDLADFCFEDLFLEVECGEDRNSLGFGDDIGGTEVAFARRGVGFDRLDDHPLARAGRLFSKFGIFAQCFDTNS